MPAFKITSLRGRNGEAETQEKRVSTVRFSLSYAFDFARYDAAEEVYARDQERAHRKMQSPL